MTKKYAEVQAVAGVELTIRAGDVVALLGPNGAGKPGFVVKDTPATQLADAVRRVQQGLRVVDPSLAAAIGKTGARTRAEAARIALDNGRL